MSSSSSSSSSNNNNNNNNNNIRDNNIHDNLLRVRNCIEVIPNFPKPGIQFQDLFPVYRDPLALECLVSHITSHILSISITKKINYILGLDARGFLLGPILSLRLGIGFIPIRKQGKLAGSCISASYNKEYGTDILELQTNNTITTGTNVIILDDLIATGGSASAAGRLVRQLGGNIIEYIFIIELLALNGRQLLDAPIYSVLQY